MSKINQIVDVKQIWTKEYYLHDEKETFRKINLDCIKFNNWHGLKVPFQIFLKLFTRLDIISFANVYNQIYHLLQN